MSWLTYACQHLPGVTVIAVGGDLDATNAGRLESFIDESRQRPDDHLVFDMTEVCFLDSSGLRVLLNAYTHCVRHGGSIRLAALRPMPARMVQITRIDAHLPVHATVEEALTIVLAPPAPAPDNGDSAA